MCERCLIQKQREGSVAGELLEHKGGIYFFRPLNLSALLLENVRSPSFSFLYQKRCARGGNKSIIVSSSLFNEKKRRTRSARRHSQIEQVFDRNMSCDFSKQFEFFSLHSPHCKVYFFLFSANKFAGCF